MKCIPHSHFRQLLRECARSSSLAIGKKLHAIIVTSGYVVAPNSFLKNTLLHFYAACGDTTTAHKLFDEIPFSYKDTVDWTALMSSFAQNKFPEKTLSLFRDFRRQLVMMDDVIVVCVLGACAQLQNSTVGMQVHSCVEKMGFLSNTKVCNAMMDMHSKCGLMSEVKCLFEEMSERNVVSWTVALDCVLKWEGVESGRKVFDEMPDRNEVAWTVMISGYIGAGFTRQGLLLLDEMLFVCGYDLNFVTLCSVLSACAQSGDSLSGRWVHAYALKTMGKDMGIKVGTALVDMYAKCGKIDTAFNVFKFMPQRNVVTWNAMLSGLAMHGSGKLAVDLLPKMMEEVKPDDLTFTAILSACSHSGLVDQGWSYFKTLQSVFGIEPKTEHYACMVDLLGRAGRLEEAEFLIKEMPIPPNAVVLGSLLGSCKVHGELQLAERVIKDLIQMDPDNTEYHIVLHNMYSLAGKRQKADVFRQHLKSRGIGKIPGMSCIHINGQVHQFSAGDKSHPRTKEIYIKLDDMIRRLRLSGYVPVTAFQVLSGNDNDTFDLEEKEQVVFSHSEKLAICFGLISTKPGSPLCIFKNLRICQDCHSAIKIVSKIYKREIIVRDRNRFHLFREGSCSCSDYW